MILSREQHRGLIKPLDTIRTTATQHYPVDSHLGDTTRSDVDGFSFVNIRWEARAGKRRLWTPNSTSYYYGIALGGLDGLDRRFHLGTPLLDERDLSLRTSDSQTSLDSRLDEEGEIVFSATALDARLASMSLAEKMGLNDVTPDHIDTLGCVLAAFVELQEVEIRNAGGSS